ncbi:MAG: Spy/CpxP family protein refolding chaperone [Burkholderiaceae bacterium]|nr:Spy/CpxP family protein refolding chaperone [Burkholderiaceae bacterium]
MMGGYGPGYGMEPGTMGGYGPGRGMGPGMMGGHGPAYGMGGMGPGMMGPGMMGHGMMGHGMMGGGIGRALWALDLDDGQRKQVLALQEELRRKHWDVAGKAQEEWVKLRDAWWTSGKRDRAAILAAYKRLGELRQQGLEQSLDAADRLDAILTDQQREQLRRWGPWWLGEGGQ